MARGRDNSRGGIAPRHEAPAAYGLTRSKTYLEISGLAYLSIDYTSAGPARQAGAPRCAVASGANARSNPSAGTRDCRMPQGVIPALLPTSSQSCVAGRCFSVADSPDEPAAVSAPFAAAVAPAGAAPAAVSDDLYLGSLT